MKVKGYQPLGTFENVASDLGLGGDFRKVVRFPPPVTKNKIKCMVLRRADYCASATRKKHGTWNINEFPSIDEQSKVGLFVNRREFIYIPGSAVLSRCDMT